MTTGLIYAFKPFGGQPTNISQTVLNALPDTPHVRKVILPAEFNPRIYTDLLNYQPNWIVGLGQYPRGSQIRIERRATNLFGTKKTSLYLPILKGQPQYLPVNFKLKPVSHSHISYYAGKYVCNYSMYIMLNRCLYTQIRFAFLHVPKSMSLKLAATTVIKLLQPLLATLYES